MNLKGDRMKDIITYDEKSKSRSNIPCINCIIYAMCKSQCQNVFGLYKYIIPKCKIVREYLKITSWTSFSFSCNKAFKKDRIK